MLQLNFIYDKMSSNIIKINYAIKIEIKIGSHHFINLNLWEKNL